MATFPRFLFASQWLASGFRERMLVTRQHNTTERSRYFPVSFHFSLPLGRTTVFTVNLSTEEVGAHRARTAEFRPGKISRISATAQNRASRSWLFRGCRLIALNSFIMQRLLAVHR